MSGRWRPAVGAGLLLALAGCGDDPRPSAAPLKPVVALPATPPTPVPAPLPVMASPVPAQVSAPARLIGTWRAAEGGFLTLAAERVALACPGLPQITGRISSVDELGPMTAVIHGPQGLRLVIARGQDVRTRTLAGQILAADGPVIDVGITVDGAAPTTLRLWGDAALTWLPVIQLNHASAPAPGVHPADQRFTAGLSDDPSLAESAAGLCASAVAGASATVLDSQAAQWVRQRQLAALAALEAAAAGETARLAEADLAFATITRFVSAYRAWIRARA
jgi:hypothetical protein